MRSGVDEAKQVEFTTTTLSLSSILQAGQAAPIYGVHMAMADQCGNHGVLLSSRGSKVPDPRFKLQVLVRLLEVGSRAVGSV